jgi:hypothetical protein
MKPEQQELDLGDTVDKEYEDVWNYGLAEWWVVNKATGETTVDHAKIVEIFYNLHDDDPKKRSWSDTSLISDTSDTMLKLLDRMARDITKRGNKPSLVVIMDSETWRDVEWFWSDAPDTIYKYTGNDFTDFKEEV